MRRVMIVFLVLCSVFLSSVSARADVGVGFDDSGVSSGFGVGLGSWVPIPEKPKGTKKTISLTFDDGPANDTEEILRVLNEHDVKATFFVVGDEVAGEEEILSRLSDSGMSVQSHSWAHDNLVSLSTSELQRDLRDTNKVIEAATGDKVSCVRPPYGSVNANVRKTAEGLGMGVELWDIDPRDWDSVGANNIFQNVKKYHHDGGVILLHDGGGDRGETVKALPRIIRFLKAENYEFVLTC